jgi:hypothetical protein
VFLLSAGGAFFLPVPLFAVSVLPAVRARFLSWRWRSG